MNNKVNIESKIDVLRRAVASHFGIEEFFVKTELNNDADSASFEIEFENPQNSLRRFHLTVYSFNITLIDSEGFSYQSDHYKYSGIQPFLNKLSRQVYFSG